MKHVTRVVLISSTLLLGGCAQIETFTAGIGQGVVLFKKAHFDVATKVEDIRCKRSIELVLKLADARGETWFNSYVQSCPEIQVIIQRIAGAIVLKQGFKLVPRNEQ